ncbi:MAG TPA: class I SAM-dependent methyltransferase [Polyangiaceae bacterium]|nr:class I SAM-dependent methyltransferase [Polyangiaceae bacterium]
MARSVSDVLEYGIGNGRIALPLARQGVRVTGIELSRPMLRDLEARLSREPADVRARVATHYGDMRRVRLRRRFPLVIAPFNVMLHLYSLGEIEAFLARVREHLSEHGEFVLDVSAPAPEDLAGESGRRYKGPPVRDPITREPLRYSELFSYDAGRQILTVVAEFRGKGRQYWQVPLTQRQFFPAELEALLHYNGFGDIRFEPDFTVGSQGSDLDSLAVRCRLRQAISRKPRRVSGRKP